MMKQKNSRHAANVTAGQTSAGERRFHNHTTRIALRQLANFAERRANVCEHPQKREKFARLARFLEARLRGGVR